MAKSLVGKAPKMSVQVPERVGIMWSNRIDDAKKFYEVEHLKWDKVFAEYQKCHDDGVETADGESYLFHLENEVDENIIRSNTDMVLKQTYMQNPTLEFTSEEVEGEEQQHSDTGAEVYEKAYNTLASRPHAPGFNLKPHVRKWIMHGYLTNYGVVRLDYQDFEGSSDQLRSVIGQLETALSNAKALNEIENIYGQLEVAHRDISLRYPRGISITNVLPNKLIVDPECNFPDLSDARWCAEEIDSNWHSVRSEFFLKTKDGYRYRYDNKTIRRKQDEVSSEASAASTIVDRIASNTTSEERQQAKDKGKVLLYRIYDKLLRRIYLYEEGHWKTPLWVYEDDLQLSRFFRHFILSFDTAIDGIVQPGVPSFYKGQVAEINKINRQASRIRSTAFGTVFYNTTSVKENTAKTIQEHFDNPKKFKLIGVQLPEGVELKNALGALPLPSLEYTQLFETRMIREGIDRYTHVTQVQRGGEFRTNTTNEAVREYQKIAATHSTYLQETVEDAIELLGWSICEIIASKFSKEDMITLLGKKWGEKFEQMSVDDFNIRYKMRIAGGSMQKPTSQFKKAEALDIAQALGQVGQSAPLTTLRLLLRMFKRAFTDFLVYDSDLDMLEQEGLANITKGQSMANGGGVTQKLTAPPAAAGQQRRNPNGQAPARPVR